MLGWFMSLKAVKPGSVSFWLYSLTGQYSNGERMTHFFNEFVTSVKTSVLSSSSSIVPR
jgi:hypothetical protein